MVFDIFVVIFDAFDTQENGAEDERENQKHRNKLFLSDLGGPNGHRHGHATADEDKGIREAPADFNGAAGKGEDVGIRVAVDGVGQEKATEEKNLGGQKDPHTERGRVFLLLKGLILPVKFSGAMHAVTPSIFNSQRA
jgi:hypothetical protein